MTVQICSETDPGKARTQNEDSVVFDAATGLCVLADGMGGHNAGEVASGMATAFIKSDMRNWIADAGKTILPTDLQAAIVQSINKANGAIFNMSRGNPQYSGMGTTLVVGVFHADYLVLAHIGDSRCYRMRQNQIQQLTKDHSVMQEQVDHGLLTPDQTQPRLGQHLVTRALGVDLLVQADFNHYSVVPNDIYLMCSDGLSDMLDDAAIGAILQSAEALEVKARQLVAAANAAGGRDNISVLLAQVGEPGTSGLLGAMRRAMQGVWPGSRQ